MTKQGLTAEAAISSAIKTSNIIINHTCFLLLTEFLREISQRKQHIGNKLIDFLRKKFRFLNCRCISLRDASRYAGTDGIQECDPPLNILA